MNRRTVPPVDGPHDTYLVWSHEHGGWWRPGNMGYTPDILLAGRYGRSTAIDICRQARPGRPEHAWPELPVRYADMMAVVKPAG